MSLRGFVLKRVALTGPTLFGVSVLAFALVHAAPGDPVDAMVAFNPGVSSGEAARIRNELGLARPVWRRYLDWIAGLARGDFGVVHRSGRPVEAVLAARAGPTLALGLFGWASALAIAIPGGVYAAVNRGRFGDHVGRLAAVCAVSLPNFWVGLGLILIGSLSLGFWPVLAPRAPLYDPATLWYLVLPGLTLGVGAAAKLLRITRTAVAEELTATYVTAARAKGLPERTVIRKHVLRNALVPVTTVAAFLGASFVSGAVVVEYVFNWPGLGRAFVRAVADREMDLVMALTLCSGLALVVANLLADVAYAVLDPRIRHE